MRNVATIILAGGQGTRLHPLTQARCKPSVCFGGGYRLIDIPISNSLNTQIQTIFVVSQYFTSSLHRHIQATYEQTTSPISLLTPERYKKEFKGTADAVRQNIPDFEATSAEYFLILSGDQLYNINFKEMIEFAKKQEADLVIASLPVREKEAQRMGVLKTNDTGQVCDFFEKPSHSQVLDRFAVSEETLSEFKERDLKKKHYLASMGIYLFKRQALFSLLKEQGNDFGRDLIPLHIKKKEDLFLSL